jgi:hypothetical protein
MYRRRPDDESSDESTTTDSGSGSETDTDTDTDDDRIQHDSRMQSHDRWRAEAHSWIGGPGRAPVVEGPGRGDTGLGLYNTELKFAEKRQTHVIMIDSLDRDQQVYPLPTQMRVKLPRVYRNVERIDIVQIKFLNGIYALSAARGNTRLWIDEGAGPLAVDIPDGTYTLQNLIVTLAAALNAAGTLTYTVSYNGSTGRVRIAASGPFSLPFKTTAAAQLQNAYSYWGLGWNLGWGGLPVDTGAATVQDADHMPRLFDDYVFLRLNETEHMNTVDHTELESVAQTQRSTGQIAHYFGKLLLNNFGCWGQTFVESPKQFLPVLGRLERLSFDWVDRWGRVLSGPDAASCDWHMTLRITEVVEGPTATASLTLPKLPL